MRKWLYRIEQVDKQHFNDKMLNSIGAEGWELVSFQTDFAMDRAFFIFKKPVPE